MACPVTLPKQFPSEIARFGFPFPNTDVLGIPTYSQAERWFDCPLCDSPQAPDFTQSKSSFLKHQIIVFGFYGLPLYLSSCDPGVTGNEVTTQHQGAQSAPREKLPSCLQK